MENSFELALKELQSMVDEGIIKLTDNKYDCFFTFWDNGKFILANVFETKGSDGLYTYTLEGEIWEEGETIEELGKNLLKWKYFEFHEWKEKELKKEILNYKQEQEDIYYMRHIR